MMPLCGLGVAKVLMHFVQVYMHTHLGTGPHMGCMCMHTHFDLT